MQSTTLKAFHPNPHLNSWIDRRILRRFATAAALLLISFAVAHAQSKTLPANTRFFVPAPSSGAVPQVESLLSEGQTQNAMLITAMEAVPRAVWLTSGTPAEVSSTVMTTLREAHMQHAVSVMVLYNIPGRDCGSYSAGGAENTADYEAWIDAIATAIGGQQAVIVLEPDALADLPSDCGYNLPAATVSQLTDDRYTQINYAVTKLESGPHTLVYIDAGNSHWQAVPIMAARLVQAGIQNAQGFFTNVSNYNLNNYESKYDTWVSSASRSGRIRSRADGSWEIIRIARASTTRPSRQAANRSIRTTSRRGFIPTTGMRRIWERRWRRRIS